jgi:hypothetical protein
VQQVLAGKLYHKTDRAWVVAPAGYTDGARALARRTDVVLFDRRSIEKLIQQAEHHAAEELRSSPEPVVAPHSEQGKKDRANYTRLLKLYEENLALLEQARAARAPHEGDPSVEQKFRETWNKICGNLEKPMGIFEKLDILERRNTDMERERKKRAELQARQQLIESNLSTVESPKQVPEASTSPETPATNTSSTRNHLVGETAITMSGDRLTVHSYESPVAPLPYMQPEEDYEFVALDVEWCTSPNSRTTLIEAHPTRFNLHMPDNTRLPRHARQFKEPVLHSTRLEPGDCARGWVTFKKPKGVKPRYIMYTDGRSLLKWRI